MTDYAELVERLRHANIPQSTGTLTAVLKGLDLYSEAAQAITALTKERDEDYAIGLKLRQELAADNARLREALSAASGRMLNAKIDLEIGSATKKRVVRALDSAIDQARAALANPAPTTG